ncbi:hypothetical protein ACLB2K_060441 [Fragaria x ananassa]
MAGFNSQRWSLKGMTALVTGGTKGIGYAIVEELAGLGATVHTCARNQEQIDERVREWKSKGFKVSGSVCDLTSKSQREELMRTVSFKFDGKLNILVNNAATVTLRSTTEYALEDLSSMMSTNVESPYHLCQLAYPLLKASGNGSIVFIASIAGLKALPRLSSYAATKSAVIQISKNLACEWAKDGIRTNTVAPWAVNTGVKVENDDHSDDFRRLIGRTPIRRVAEPNEISSLVTFLCLPAASYINGQVCWTGWEKAQLFLLSLFFPQVFPSLFLSESPRQHLPPSGQLQLLHQSRSNSRRLLSPPGLVSKPTTPPIERNFIRDADCPLTEAPSSGRHSQRFLVHLVALI